MEETNSDFVQKDDKTFSLTGKALAEMLDSVLKKNASFRFKAKGYSMHPFIRDADIITIVPLSKLPCVLGRNVGFIRPEGGNLVVHRIISSAKNGYWIKGDNSFCFDGLIPRANILGCVARVERNGKEVFLGLGAERRLVVVLSRLRLIAGFFFAWRALPFYLKESFKGILHLR